MQERVDEMVAQGQPIGDAQLLELASEHAREVVEQTVQAARTRESERAREVSRRQAVNRQLKEFERDADRLNERIAKAAVTFEAACVELEAASAALDELLRDNRDKLHRLGWDVLDPSDVFNASGYRIILVRDMLQKMKLHRVDGTVRVLPDAERYAAWARDQRAERDSRLAPQLG